VYDVAPGGAEDRQARRDFIRDVEGGGTSEGTTMHDAETGGDLIASEGKDADGDSTPIVVSHEPTGTGIIDVQPGQVTHLKKPGDTVRTPRPDGEDGSVEPPKSPQDIDPGPAQVTDPARPQQPIGGVSGVDHTGHPVTVTDPPEFGGSGGAEGGVRPIDSLVTDPPEPEMSAAGAAAAADAGAVSDTPDAPDPGEDAPSGGEGGGGGSQEVVEVEMVAPSPIPEVGSVEATLAEVAGQDAGTGVPAVGRDAGVAEAGPAEEIEEADDPGDDTG
jgi:hypothetical protein